MKKKVIITKLDFDFIGEATIFYKEQLSNGTWMDEDLVFHCSSLSSLPKVLDNFKKYHSESIVITAHGKEL